MRADDYESIKVALDAGLGAGRTADGEMVTFGYGPYDTVTRTIYQGNGWALTQYFHEDGTVEEMFTR